MYMFISSQLYSDINKEIIKNICLKKKNKVALDHAVWSHPLYLMLVYISPCIKVLHIPHDDLKLLKVCVYVLLVFPTRIYALWSAFHSWLCGPDIWHTVGAQLEKGTATHSIILAWKAPKAEEPGALQSVGSQRDGHGWSDLAPTNARRCSIEPGTWWVLNKCLWDECKGDARMRKNIRGLSILPFISQDLV